MTVDHLLTETAQITDRTATTTRDGYGNVLVAETTRSSPCWHHQIVRDETDPVAIQTWTLYLPAGVLLDAHDSVTIGAESFEVVGPPWQTVNPRTGEQGHIEATLRRTDG